MKETLRALTTRMAASFAGIGLGLVMACGGAPSIAGENITSTFRAVLVGRVMRSDGSPVAGAVVVARGFANRCQDVVQSYFSGTTAADGRFFSNMQIGVADSACFTVQVTPPSGSGFAVYNGTGLTSRLTTPWDGVEGRPRYDTLRVDVVLK